MYISVYIYIHVYIGICGSFLQCQVLLGGPLMRDLVILGSILSAPDFRQQACRLPEPRNTKEPTVPQTIIRTDAWCETVKEPLYGLRWF